MEYWISLRRALFARLATRIPGRRFAVWLGFVLALLLAGELAGRAIGLHTPVLYEATSYGYRVQPDQDLRRFGNRIFYNAYGMRSESVTLKPAPGVLRILCVGDSIANGGAVTDQADTFPYVLEKMLRARMPGTEVLNASAPGWAIANEAGWLNEYGTFGSRMVILTISTHDLFQERAGAEIVDRHPSFPGHAPHTALEDIVSHYLVPRLLHQNFMDPGTGISSGSSALVLSAVSQVLAAAATAEAHGAKLFLLFVEQPAPLELANPATAAAKIFLFDTLRANHIGFANTREAASLAGGAALFRDGLHPNFLGNRVLAEVAMQMVAPQLAEAQP